MWCGPDGSEKFPRHILPPKRCFLQLMFWTCCIITQLGFDYSHGSSLNRFDFGRFSYGQWGMSYRTTFNMPTLIHDKNPEAFGYEFYWNMKRFLRDFSHALIKNFFNGSKFLQSLEQAFLSKINQIQKPLGFAEMGFCTLLTTRGSSGMV